MGCGASKSGVVGAAGGGGGEVGGAVVGKQHTSTAFGDAPLTPPEGKWQAGEVENAGAGELRNSHSRRFVDNSSLLESGMVSVSSGMCSVGAIPGTVMRSSSGGLGRSISGLDRAFDGRGGGFGEASASYSAGPGSSSARTAVQRGIIAANNSGVSPTAASAMGASAGRPRAVFGVALDRISCRAPFAAASSPLSHPPSPNARLLSEFDPPSLLASTINPMNNPLSSNNNSRNSSAHRLLQQQQQQQSAAPGKSGGVGGGVNSGGSEADVVSVNNNNNNNTNNSCNSSMVLADSGAGSTSSAGVSSAQTVQQQQQHQQQQQQPPQLASPTNARLLLSSGTTSPFPAPTESLPLQTSGSFNNSSSTMVNSNITTLNGVPQDVAWPVAVLCEHIENRGLDIEGLFRVPGDKLQFDIARLALVEGRDPCRETEDIHALAQLLRTFFRELPTPLLPHDMVVSAGKTIRDDDEKDIPIVLSILQMLTPAHLGNTRRLVRMLHRLTTLGGMNAPSSAEVAVCWAHTMARAPTGSDHMRVIPKSGHVTAFVRRLIELRPQVFRESGLGKQMLRGFSSNEVARDMLMASHSIGRDNNASSNANSSVTLVDDEGSKVASVPTVPYVPSEVQAATDSATSAA